jgi:SPP1 gp7 family putative phage head morphogenesis protein
MEQLLQEKFPDVLRAAHASGARAGIAPLRRQLRKAGLRVAAAGDGGVRLKFDAKDIQGYVWATNHAGELVKGISEESRSAIRKTVSRGFLDGVPPVAMARSIRNSVGLTEAQAQAVSNLRQKIQENPGKLVRAGKVPIRVPSAGLPAGRLDRELARYAERLTKQRAENIARTESMRAVNEGERTLWLQQVKAGLLSGQEKRQWLTSDDERLCPICRPLNGELATLTGTFAGGFQVPPAHPRCRCTTFLVEVKVPSVRVRRPISTEPETEPVSVPPRRAAPPDPSSVSSPAESSDSKFGGMGLGRTYGSPQEALDDIRTQLGKLGLNIKKQPQWINSADQAPKKDRDVITILKTDGLAIKSDNKLYLTPQISDRLQRGRDADAVRVAVHEQLHFFSQLKTYNSLSDHMEEALVEGLAQRIVKANGLRPSGVAYNTNGLINRVDQAINEKFKAKADQEQVYISLLSVKDHRERMAKFEEITGVSWRSMPNF